MIKKLEPHKTIINRWIRKGISDFDIAKKLRDNYGVGVKSTTIKTYRLNMEKQRLEKEINQVKSHKESANTNKKESVHVSNATAKRKKISAFEIKKVVKELKNKTLYHLNKDNLSAGELNELSQAVLHIMEIESYFPEKFKDW